MKTQIRSAAPYKFHALLVLVLLPGFSAQEVPAEQKAQVPRTMPVTAPEAEEVPAAESAEAQGGHADHLRRIRIGEQVPKFALTSLLGDEIKRSDYLGRTLVLVYLSAEQRNSERAAADAARVVKKYVGEALDLLFVTADASHQEYFKALFDKDHITGPLGFDAGHELYSKLGLIVFPTTLIVGPDGTLKHVILTRRSDYSHRLDTFVSHSLGKITSEVLEQRIVAPSMSRSSSKTMAQRHREAARLLRESELHRGAEQELLLAIELAPKSTPIRLDLVDLYIALERYGEAEALLEAILSRDSGHRGAKLLLGISRFHTGALDEAKEILLEALVMNPDPERTHYYLGRIYEARGQQTEAIAHYRRALDRLLNE